MAPGWMLFFPLVCHPLVFMYIWSFVTLLWTALKASDAWYYFKAGFLSDWSKSQALQKIIWFSVDRFVKILKFHIRFHLIKFVWLAKFSQRPRKYLFILLSSLFSLWQSLKSCAKILFLKSVYTFVVNCWAVKRSAVFHNSIHKY